MILLPLAVFLALYWLVSESRNLFVLIGTLIGVTFGVLLAARYTKALVDGTLRRDVEATTGQPRGSWHGRHAARRYASAQRVDGATVTIVPSVPTR